MSESKIVPNTFQTPNVLVDDLMRLMTGDEVKCYLVIVRKTFGWLKRTDRIAKSQIIELTGLSDGTVDVCMKSLVKFNIVKRLAENDPAKNYGVEWEIQTDESAIYYGSLQGRANDRKAVGAARTAKMRSRGGDVAQPQVVAHTGGGDVAQPPQKTLSKTTKEHIYIDPIAAKISELKFSFNPNSGTIINIWKEDFTDDVIIRALEMARGKNINYADKILIGWKANGVPPTREQQIAAAVNQKGTRNYGNAKTNPGTSIQEPTEAERDIARQILARRNAQAANVSV